VHPTAASVQGITEYDGSELSFRMGPSHDFIELALSVVSDFFSNVALTAAAVFDRPSDSILQARESFQKLIGSAK